MCDEVTDALMDFMPVEKKFFGEFFFVNGLSVKTFKVFIFQMNHYFIGFKYF